MSVEEEESIYKLQKEIAERKKVSLVFRVNRRENDHQASSLTDKISIDTMVLGQLTVCLLMIKRLTIYIYRKQ